MRSRLLAVPAALLLSVGLLTACGDDDSSSSDASATDTAPVNAACAEPGAPLTPLSEVAGGPIVQIPVPSGWEKTDAPAGSGTDQVQVRLALVAKGLTSNGFTPKLVVTSNDSGADAQAVLDGEIRSVQQADPNATVTPGSTCGYPSATAAVELPAAQGAPARAGMLKTIVVSQGTGTVTYSLTAQSTDGGNSDYQQAVQTMFDGVQINK